MSNLYELKQEIEELIKLVDQSDIEDVMEYALNQIEALGLEYDEKIENIGLWIKRLESEVESWKAEEHRISTERKQKEARIDSLKQWLGLCMGQGKFSSPRLTIPANLDKSIQYTSKSTKDVPVAFIKVIEKQEIDTEAVKRYLDMGETLNFAKYVLRKRVK